MGGNKAIKIATKILFVVSAFSFWLPSGFAAKTPVEEALLISGPERLGQLKRDGLKSKVELEQIAFSKSHDLQSRWRAVTAVGRLYPRHSKEFLSKALKSSEWYMRNAALVVIPYAERGWAIEQAQKHLSDPALVVRTAAVQALQHIGATSSRALLWEKLYASENYHAGDSLWIRRQIVEALSQLSRSGDEAKFIQVLSDPDTTLHPIATQTLERLTQQRMASATEWKKWWQRRNL